MAKIIKCSNCKAVLDINTDFVYYSAPDNETLCFDCYDDNEIYERVNQ